MSIEDAMKDPILSQILLAIKKQELEEIRKRAKVGRDGWNRKPKERDDDKS